MWEYKKVLVQIKDTDNINIVSKMNEFGELGWEIFSISEEIEQYKRYNDIITNYSYTLYMKKIK